jgi:uncharacterized membrane protein
MKALKIIGLIVLIFFVSQELVNAYRQIGWDVIFIIIPLAVIIMGVIYFRKRNGKYKDKI